MLALVESVIKDIGTWVPKRWSRGTTEEIREKMVFARALAPGVTEMAEISEVRNDGSGNPHIRYRVFTRDQQGSYYDGSRVLARTTFLKLYKRVM